MTDDDDLVEVELEPVSDWDLVGIERGRLHELQLWVARLELAVLDLYAEDPGLLTWQEPEHKDVAEWVGERDTRSV